MKDITLLKKQFLYKRNYLVNLTGNTCNNNDVMLYEIKYTSHISICSWTAWVERYELSEVKNDVERE